jgi:ATP adenylyltransferase
MLARGTLWSLILEATRRALDSGALQSIPTEYELVEDGGIHFIVRVVRALARKGNLLRPQRDESDRSNPFLTYHPAMRVTDISRSHVCLLNKYNVVEHHILIVTREFRHQETRLTHADFAALGRCMAEFDGLGFYNSGADAGASQPHKHLQLVPLPLAPSGLSIPVEPLLDSVTYRHGIGRIAAFPFNHAVSRVDWKPGQALSAAAKEAADGYAALLVATGIEAGGKRSRQPRPYNLLITRRWMLVVPRTQEFFASVSLNALAFAGTFLVHDRRQLDELRRHGPLAALRAVTQSGDG